MTKKDDREKFGLQIPLDVSGIEGFKPEKPVKVIVQDSKGILHSKTVRLDEKGNLVLMLDAGQLVQRPPLIYQEVGGVRTLRSGSWVSKGKN